MSKEAALRAMREARYAERNASASSVRRAPAAVAPATRPKAVTKATDSSIDELCGHRSMNNRSCTRKHGHAEKSHRYS